MTAPNAAPMQPTSVGQRIARLAQLVRQQGFMSISELSAALDVSEMTVRRDLQRAAATEGLRIVRGGVTTLPEDALAGSGAFAARAKRMAAAKTAIVRAAAADLTDGMTIGIDAGTTGLLLARALPPAMSVTVITYSAPVLSALAQAEGVDLVMLGGVLHRETQSFAGAMTVSMLKDLRAEVLFLTASGVRDGSIYCANDFDAVTKRAFIKIADRIVLLTDSSKFQRSAMVRVCGLDDIDAVITDWAIRPQTAEAVRSSGVELRIAQSPVPEHDGRPPLQPGDRLLPTTR